MQFDFGPFREFFTKLDIELCFIAVCHPQSNRVIEHAYGNILLDLNRHLVGLVKCLWVEELPKMLWSLRTTITCPIGCTTFRLLFGDKAMTSTKIRGCSL